VPSANAVGGVASLWSSLLALEGLHPWQYLPPLVLAQPSSRCCCRVCSHVSLGPHESDGRRGTDEVSEAGGGAGEGGRGFGEEGGGRTSRPWGWK
jgi:hypothetical protein